jgi:hypothetical protein
MENKCMICGTTSISKGGVGATSNIFIDCPNCGVKYEVSWIVYETLKKIPLNVEDGKILLNHIQKKCIEAPQYPVIDIGAFKKLFRKLPQD